MAAAKIRAAPSGKLISPLPAKGRNDWNVGGPLTLELLPANHPTGYYALQLTSFAGVVASGGNVGVVINWSEPIFGSTSFNFGTYSATASGLAFTVLRNIQSSGLAAITATFTPAAVTGSPRFNIAGAIDLVALPVP